MHESVTHSAVRAGVCRRWLIFSAARKRNNKQLEEQLQRQDVRFRRLRVSEGDESETDSPISPHASELSRDAQPGRAPRSKLGIHRERRDDLLVDRNRERRRPSGGGKHGVVGVIVVLGYAVAKTRD